LGHETEIPEDHDNLEDNSLQKAMTIWQEFKINCMAEDSGLFIDALNGEPGVYSARYAGPQKNDGDNIQKVLKKLENQSNRKAYFKTVFTLILDGVAHQFTGLFNGEITKAPQGNGGFGYDPIFEFKENTTLAEISLDEKKKISHRSIALKQLIEFIHQL
jgi:XTP/dITP diphosphohydrolase